MRVYSTENNTKNNKNKNNQDSDDDYGNAEIL